MSTANPAPSSAAPSTFINKYNEFCDDLQSTLPELRKEIFAALELSNEQKLERFQTEVLPNCGAGRSMSDCPETVLPGVTIPVDLWKDLSDKSQAAIQEYMTILSFCAMMESAKGDSGLPKEFMGDFLKTWREKISQVDFESLSKKLTDLVGNLGPSVLPKIPERLMKGHLARLAEELVKEFKPEDFGLSPEELAACDKDPARAFTLLTDLYTNKPEILQRAVTRIASRLQDKVRRGEIRPDQIAAEAEEMLKEFSGNGAFKELLESFKGMFGMEDPDLAREMGREGDARRNIVKERLRKKLEAKKAAKK